MEARRDGRNDDVRVRIGERGGEEEGEGFRRTVASARDSSGNGNHRQTQQQSTMQSMASSPSPRISQTTSFRDPGITSVSLKAGDAGLASTVWKAIFLLHLIAVFILTVYLAIHGLLNKRRSFSAAHWYLPILSAAGFSALTSAAWLLVVLRWPSAAVKSSFWLSPLLTVALSVLLLDAGTPAGLSFGALGVVLSLALSLYACWTRPRLPHANKILTSSLAGGEPAAGKLGVFAAVSLLAGLLYSATWILGIGGVYAEKPRFSAVYVIVLLLSFSWTMQVIRNALTVTIAGFAYMWFGRGAEIDPGEAWRNAWTISLGSVTLGSAVVPAIVTLRGAARSLSLLAGSADEFLFSCVDCFAGLADRLIALGNRWGFVQVGVYAKGFGAASEDTWRLFREHGMELVIDLDVTSSFCFLSGMAGGGGAGLVAGIWAAVVDKRYTTELALYSFVVGYFMTRITLAWPQACVSALHVAYAEKPRNEGYFSGISHRVRTLNIRPNEMV